MRTPEDTVLSTGVFCIPGQQRGYRDDKRGGGGTVDLVQAIEKSVNTYFYKLAHGHGHRSVQRTGWAASVSAARPAST